MRAPTLMLFYARWCSPCRTMQRTVAQIKADLGNTVCVVKIDIEKEPSYAEKFFITVLPTLVICKNGGQSQRLTGVRGRREIITALMAV